MVHRNWNWVRFGVVMGQRTAVTELQYFSTGIGEHK